MSTDGQSSEPMTEGELQNAFVQAAATPAQTPAAPVAPAATPEAGAVGAAVPAEPQGQPLPAAPTAPLVSAIAAAAREAGLAIDGLSDEQVVQAMRDTIVRTQPFASYGQRLAPYADQIREFFDSQAAPQQPAAATPAPAAAEPAAWDDGKYFEEKWPAPKWEDTYTFAIQQGMVTRNSDTGLYEATPGYEAHVLEILPGLNRHATWNSQQWTSITKGNPYQQFYQVLSEPLRHAWQQDMEKFVEQRLSARETEQRINSFESDNANWLYGTDPQSGARILTAKGQSFYDEIDVLREAGVADPQKLITLAMRRMQTGESAVAPPAAPLAPPIPAAPVNPLAASAQQTTSFLQNALERASHSPSSGGAQQVAPDHPVSVTNESELNNMFVSSFKASAPG